ncbi:MAG TPA: phosphohistidine phosphatase SixA [Vicinamibacteria bacterium]|nr:phosphohistidine phosphatase SixA [Vicinamibacteria bacterium]
MELYLVRHGEADHPVPERDRDDGPPLSQNGLAQARRAAHFAARLGVKVVEIRHSDKLRAVQTAQEFERALGCPRRQLAGLGPNDDINPLRREAAGLQENIMVVGHLPYLGRIAGALLAQDESKPVVVFHPAALIRLDRRDDDRWSLQLVMPTGVMS